MNEIIMYRKYEEIMTENVTESQNDWMRKWQCVGEWYL